MAASCILHDTVRELWLKISSAHSSYLLEENLTLKAKYRNSFQKYILDFLTIVPHHQKFSFQETSEVLCNSIKKVKNCNMLKLANAWLSLTTYADNLYSQPWRKEYHEIKTYGGCYKHQIESCLIGVEYILEIMGYERKPDHKFMFNMTTDPDLISAVSLDSFIAFAECQVIFSIYKEILKKIPSCSLADILDYRQSNICSIDEAVQNIYFLHYHPAANFCATCHRDCYSCPCVPVPYVQYTPCSVCHPSKCHSIHSSNKNGYRNNSSIAIRNGIVDKSHRRKTCEYNVPTAKLVDVDGTDLHCLNHRKSISDHRLYDSRITNSKHADHCSDLTVYGTSCLSDRSASQEFEDSNDNWSSWDYVYKGLENKDRFKENKDKSKEYKNRSNECNNDTKDIRVENGKQQYSQTKYATTKPIKVSDALNNLKLDAQSDRDVPDMSRSFVSNRSMSNNSKTMFDFKRKSTKSNADIEEIGRWECIKCTYHNSKKSKICEMCGKSKKLGNELKPLVSGGKQCPHCTLVNSRHAMKCEACNNSLKDSPTYI